MVKTSMFKTDSKRG